MDSNEKKEKARAELRRLFAAVESIDTPYDEFNNAESSLGAVDSAYSFNEYTREHSNPDEALEPMEFLDEIDWKPADAIQSAFYGYRFNPWHMDGESREREAFNPNDDYFTFNGYGNLVSVGEHDRMRYWARVLDIENYLDAAEQEERLDEVCAELGVDADDEDGE